jgi:hypothetical protein
MPPSRSALPAAKERGLVTIELAFAILAAVVVLMTLCWGIFLVVIQLRLVDTAGEVARQAARGDRAAIARVEAQAPPGATVSVRVAQPMTRVEVRVRVAPFAGLPALLLGAAAEVATEPGVAG